MSSSCRTSVTLLRDWIPAQTITALRNAAARCLPQGAASHSITLAGAGDCADWPDPLTYAGLDPSTCRLEHSWLRRKVPPDCQPHIWHQDGGLGVDFPPHPGSMPPLTRLLTVWMPLDPCGEDAPGLEFVTRPLDTLLHFAELNDAGLRARFDAEEFWAPVLAPGDALLFGCGTLHRTHYRAGMRQPRTSIEYRLFQDSRTP